MPFVKNAEGKICLALEPETRSLLQKGYKLLDAAEEAAHRAALRVDEELTSFESQEKARIEAGVYTDIYPTVDAEANEATKVGVSTPNTTVVNTGSTPDPVNTNDEVQPVTDATGTPVGNASPSPDATADVTDSTEPNENGGTNETNIPVTAADANSDISSESTNAA